jgi:predicted dehydrogenase
MGRGWVKNLKENPRAAVAALVDIRLEAAHKAATDFGVDPAQCYADLKEALKRTEAEFVVDVTIPEAHCPTTLTALAAGLPVIGEKPMAESMVSARKMVHAAEKANRLYMVSQSRRYDPKHVATQRLLQSGCVGDITTVNCDFYIGAHFGGFRDEMPSPLILDMAIHHFDLCRFLTGADPVAVYAHEFNPKGSWYRGDVNASAIFEMSNGVVFTYRGSWCAEGCHTSWNGDWRIIGSSGTVLMEKDQLPRGSRPKPGGQRGFHLEQEDIRSEAPTINGAGIAGALNEFLDYLETGKVPQGECHDNIKSLAMVFAAIESSRRHRRVPVKA